MTVPPAPATPPILEHLLDMFIEVEWFDATKEKLSAAAVLTGLLDYGLFGEKVPPCFVSEGFAAHVEIALKGLIEEVDERKLKENLDKRAHDYIRYEALRDINIPRHLGIPHPESYAVQALAIHRHWKEIAVHCNQPKPAVSRVHVRQVGGGCIFEMNYKGIERFQFEEEEIEWMSGAQFVVEADIASCFPSIYTHAIPWALHGKSESKKSSSLTKLPGNLLDKSTQNTRDKQTNGLLIGPHASNIVSEIILTRVDTELQAKGYKNLLRHVDDYVFYASTFEQAESFVKDLGMSLRTYEMGLNEKKTNILPLPKPSDANWRLVLNRFLFPKGEEIRFSVIRSYLDLALACAQEVGKSTPLNYAIKTLAGNGETRKLNPRAKRMYAGEAMNLALAYPYLAPLLDRFVFEPFWHDGLKEKLVDFTSALVTLGTKKIYPDTVAHALYLALKYEVSLSTSEAKLVDIVALDDCIANVLLLEYATQRGLKVVKKAIVKRASELKKEDSRAQDKNWLLIFSTWSETELVGKGQVFLAGLKKSGFKFFSMPTGAIEASLAAGTLAKVAPTPTPELAAASAKKS
jgi:hypothetical protein